MDFQEFYHFRGGRTNGLTAVSISLFVVEGSVMSLSSPLQF